MSTPSPPPPLPVGFRFRPTDEELVRHYLKPKIAGRPHPDLLFIPDVDLAACEPWDLPAKALIKSDDPEWFFFAPLDRKYPGGHRSNRSTAAGYWKATGKDRLIRSRPAGALIGVKKTLVFHRGRAPRGRRTAWIMHEYRATEPQIQQGQNGSFVLYRLFNKHEEEEETPAASNSEDADSPPTCSPASANPVVKSENSTHPLTPINDNDQTAPPQENDPLLDVLSHLPDLQPDQAFDGFPTVASPMRPYSDHPFLGDAGGQDLSAYFSSIIAQQQDLEEALSCANGNADMNPTAVLMPSSTTVGDETGDARCSSGTRILQTDTDDGNRDIGGAPDTYIASAQMSHLCKQPQLHSNSAEMEPPSITAQFSAGSWTPYPQQLFDVVEASDTFDGLEGWAAEPMMQQFTVSDLPGPQQGTATRRIRLVHSVTKPVVTSHLESEDEVGSSDSTGNLSTTHEKDYDNLISETTAGEVTRALDGGLLPTQVVSSVEVAEKCCAFSSDEPISSNAKLPNEANLKQRLKQENRKAQNVRDDLQDSGCVPIEPRHRRQQHAPIASAVRLLCLALVVVLAFVCLCKSSLFKYMH